MIGLIAVAPVHTPVFSLLNSARSRSDLLFVEVPGIASLMRGAYRGNLLNYIHIGHVLEFNEKTLVNTLNYAGFDTLAYNETCRGIFTKSAERSMVFENAYQTTKKQILSIESEFLKSS